MVAKMCSFVFVVLVPALGQSGLQPEPIPAASGPAFNVSAGYSFLTMSVPEAGRVNLNGLNVNGGLDFSWRWGVTVDSTYVRTPSVLEAPHQAYVLDLVAGPVFYPIVRTNTRMFVHAMIGAGMVDGVAPKSDLDYRHGWVIGTSYVAGAGIERYLRGPFALRVSGDYLRTAFFDYSGVLQPQNNLRVTVGLVFPAHRRGTVPTRESVPQ